MRNQRLPSTRGLRAFEATARHLSFSQAAIELNLTQGAVSHQVKKVEELLGNRLFIRQGNEVSLTDVGREYLTSVRTMLAEMMSATSRAMDRERGDILTVASLVTFANKCLFPHLNDFMRLHPGIEIQVRTVFPGTPVNYQDFDVLIHYGSDADWGGPNSCRISREVLFPVCSPRYLEETGALRQPADLENCRLIYAASPLILRDDWKLWLKYAEVPDLPVRHRITFDHLNPSYQAAIEGLGIALGRNAVVKADLQAGRLIEPFNIRMPTSLGYYLVVPQPRSDLQQVHLFREWVRNELSKDLL